MRVEGLAGSGVDVLVRILHANGAEQVARLTPSMSTLQIAATGGSLQVARTYFALGVHHILLGFDHLLFVLALLLIVCGGRRIVVTITAFTIAHSITLAAAALDVVMVPAPPIEAMIALSIVFVACEVVRGLRGTPGATARAPWLVAFTFGLLHGLGFASALSEIGLPHNAVPQALLFFNGGVEAGQLLFVGAVLQIRTLARRLEFSWLRNAPLATAYAIGAIAMFWVIERVGAFGATVR